MDSQPTQSADRAGPFVFPAGALDQLLNAIRRRGFPARRLPAVADARARHLGRPVRHLRLHGVRPLCHLVPAGIDITEEVAAIAAEP